MKTVISNLKGALLSGLRLALRPVLRLTPYLALAGVLALALVLGATALLAPQLPHLLHGYQHSGDAGIQLSWGGMELRQRHWWRQHYRLTDLRVGDAEGGWRLHVPVLDVETDVVGSVLRLGARVRSVDVPEGAEVELRPELLRPGGEPLDIGEVLRLVETVADYLRVDSLSLPELGLRLYEAEGAEAVASYLIGGSFGRSGGQAAGKLEAVDALAGRRVFELGAHWYEDEGWTAKLHVDDLDLAAALVGTGTEAAVIDADVRLAGHGGRLMPQAAEGYLELVSLRTAAIPWPLSVRVPELSALIESGEDGEGDITYLHLPSIEGVLGEGRIAIEDLSLRLATELDEAYLRIARQQLGALVALIPSLVDLPPDMAASIAEMALSGEMSNLVMRVPLSAPIDFVLTGHLRGLSAQPTTSSWPGFSNLSGDLFVRASGGVLRFRDMERGSLYIPSYFEEWLLGEVTGALAWHLHPDRVLISGDDLSLQINGNQLSGMMSVTLPLASPNEGTRLEALLAGDALKAADAWLFTPRLEGLDGLVTYLRTAMRGGSVDVPSLSVWADLQAGGDFNLHTLGRGRQVDMEYAPGWPELRGGEAQIEVWGDLVFVDAESGSLGEVTVDSGQVRVLGSSARPGWTRVEMSGDFHAEVQQGVDFLLASELRQYVGPALQGAVSTGAVKGRMNTSAVLIPPQGSSAEVVSDMNIVADFDGVRFVREDWGLDVRQLSGQVVMDTQDNLSDKGLRAEIFGTPVQIALSGEGPIGEPGSHSYIEVTGGKVGKDDLYTYVEEWNRFVEGSTDYVARVEIPYSQDEFASMTVRSDLRGMAVDLPAPVGKTAEQALASTMKLEFPPGEDTPVRIQMLGGPICTDLTFVGEVLGGIAWINEAEECQESWRRPRLQITPLELLGWVEHASVSEQIELFERLPLDDEGESELGRIEITVASGDMAGMLLKDVLVVVTPTAAGSNLRVSGEAVNGTIYIPDAEDEPFEVRLEELIIPESFDPMADSAEESGPEQVGLSNVHIENLVYQGRSIGEWRLKTIPLEGSLKIEFMPNESGAVRVLPHPRSLGEPPHLLMRYEPSHRTSLEAGFLVSNIEALEAFLPAGLFNRLDYIRAQVRAEWPGRVTEFEPHRMKGDVSMYMSDANINLSEAGPLEALLTVSSMFDLGNLVSSAVTLNLHQVSGAWFREVQLDAEIEDANVELRQVRANGSGGTIYARGSLKLPEDEAESPPLRLQARVLLPVGKALPWYAAALSSFSGGLGLLLINELLGKPLNRATGIELRLGGTLAAPEILSEEDAGGDPIPVWVEDLSQPYGGSVYTP